MLDYIFNNQLWVDKSTYITVVIGQISTYSIMLAFYQFIVSFSSDAKVVYLGYSLKEYLVYKHVKAQKIVKSKWFMALLILEVLYKPIINVYRGKICAIIPFGTKLISCMNFLWYAFVVAFFLIFAIMLYQCTKCMFSFRYAFNAEGLWQITRDINNKIFKEMSMDLSKKNLVDNFYEAISMIDKDIKNDNDNVFLERYNELIFDVFNWYIEKKSKHGENEVQTGWIYNMNREAMLIRMIVSGELLGINCRVLEKMDRYVFKLIELNLNEAKLAGYEDIDMFGLAYAYAESQKKICLKEWGEILIILFGKAGEQQRQRIVEYLCRNNDPNSLCSKLYEHSCKKLLWKVVEEAFLTGNKDGFLSFTNVVREPSPNKWLTEILIDYLMSYADYDASDIVEMINSDNSTYLFTYMILRYSIYAERNGGKNINVKVFKTLWKEVDINKIDKDILFARIKQSNIGHRFSEDMFSVLLSCFSHTLSKGLLSEVFNKNLLNVFMVFVIKICVCDQRYIDWKSEDNGVKVYILNNLVKNEELLRDDLIQRQLYDMQCDYFMNIEELPEEFDINLRSLLLANVNEKILLKDESTIWRNRKYIGEYALIKYDGNNTQSIEIKKLIKEAYVSYNGPIEEYIDYLERECELCGRPLGFVQCERMKKYLRSIF